MQRAPRRCARHPRSIKSGRRSAACRSRSWEGAIAAPLRHGKAGPSRSEDRPKALPETRRPECREPERGWRRSPSRPASPRRNSSAPPLHRLPPGRNTTRRASRRGRHNTQLRRPGPAPQESPRSRERSGVRRRSVWSRQVSSRAEHSSRSSLGALSRARRLRLNLADFAPAISSWTRSSTDLTKASQGPKLVLL